VKGAKPVDLPVEQPTKLAFFVSLRTANALGVAVSATFLLRPDGLIQ